MKRIVAVVVTYNRCELLKECIEALRSIEEKIDIMVVDNASTDNTSEIVSKYSNDSNFLYYNTGKNIGGAGGFNYGIKRAYKLGYDYIWIMDDDTIVNEDTLQKLVDTANSVQDKFGWLSSLALWTDGKECVMNYHEVAMDWNREKKNILNGRLLCQAATFVSLFLNRKAIQEQGLPIKEYFIWGDDTEYTKRISREYPCYLVLPSQVTHKMKNNEGTTNLLEIEDVDRIERSFYSIRNDFCTFKRISFWKMIGFLKNQIGVLKKVIFTNNPYKMRKMRVLIKALWCGLRFNPKIERV